MWQVLTALSELKVGSLNVVWDAQEEEVTPIRARNGSPRGVGARYTARWVDTGEGEFYGPPHYTLSWAERMARCIFGTEDYATPEDAPADFSYVVRIEDEYRLSIGTVMGRRNTALLNRLTISALNTNRDGIQAEGLDLNLTLRYDRGSYRSLVATFLGALEPLLMRRNVEGFAPAPPPFGMARRNIDKYFYLKG